MLFSLFCQFRRLVFDQSSPVHPVSESTRGTMSVTHRRPDERTRTEILVSNIGLLCKYIKPVLGGGGGIGGLWGLLIF